jgi:hypothetical protein
MSEETGAMSEKALHILRAAVADAGDEPGVYVSRARVMEQTGVSDLEEFERIAEDLAERGFIDEGVNRYEFFVVTLRGIGAGTTEATEAPREATSKSREAPDETVSEEPHSTHAAPPDAAGPCRAPLVVAAVLWVQVSRVRRRLRGGTKATAEAAIQ